MQGYYTGIPTTLGGTPPNTARALCASPQVLKAVSEYLPLAMGALAYQAVSHIDVALFSHPF